MKSFISGLRCSFSMLCSVMILSGSVVHCVWLCSVCVCVSVWLCIVCDCVILHLHFTLYYTSLLTITYYHFCYSYCNLFYFIIVIYAATYSLSVSDSSVLRRWKQPNAAC
jgi:hypothetical protein